MIMMRRVSKGSLLVSVNSCIKGSRSRGGLDIFHFLPCPSAFCAVILVIACCSTAAKVDLVRIYTKKSLSETPSQESYVRLGVTV